jgi:hypothetical protein
MAKKKPEDAPETGEAPKMKKSDAMREAIKRGIDKPQDASEFIKSEFGLDVTPQVFSSFKSISKKKGGNSSGGKRRGRPPQAQVATGGGVGGGNGRSSSPAELARAVKTLVDAHGAEAIREMVGVFEG